MSTITSPKKIELIDMKSMYAFPDNPVDENIMFAEKINEIIERVNLITDHLVINVINVKG